MELRPFQKAEVDELNIKKRGCIFWDMGLGKTGAASTIGARNKCKRWLIICPTNAFSVWRDEAPRWIKSYWAQDGVLPPIKIDFVDDSVLARQFNHQSPYKEGHIHIKVITIDTFLRDWRLLLKTGLPGKRAQTVHFQPIDHYHIPEIVVFDECKRIRNKDTQAFKIFSAWCKYYNPPFIYLLTGTPGHEPRHFWTYFNVLNPRMFSSYWKFVNMFHNTIQGPFGLEILGAKNLDGWRRVLKMMASVVKEQDVEGERPPYTRQLLEVEMTEEQKRLYHHFQNDMMVYIEASDRLILTQNEFVQLSRIRQILVCPKIVDESLDYGEAIKDFADVIDPDHHYVLFTPFTKAFPYFMQYLREHKNKYKVYSLQSGISTTQRDAQLAAYKSTPSIMICSILYAQAFSLEPATKAFFIGYDWDPDNNRQAEKRLHRLTTQNPINAYYYTYKSTFDYSIAHVVNIKQEKVNETLPPKEFLAPHSTPTAHVEPKSDPNLPIERPPNNVL